MFWYCNSCSLDVEFYTLEARGKQFSVTKPARSIEISPYREYTFFEKKLFSWRRSNCPLSALKPSFALEISSISIEKYFFNPLTANDKYIGHLTGAACRRRSAFHRQNHEELPGIF